MQAETIGSDTFIAEIFAGVAGVPVVALMRPVRNFKGRQVQRAWTPDFFAHQAPGAWCFCTSTTSTVENGYARRRKQDLAVTACIVLDDVGSKVDRARVDALLPPPSWVLMSSMPKGTAGNFQFGYILDGGEPPADAGRLLERLAGVGLTDAGAKDAAHIFRLPGSLNEKYDPPFAARLEAWAPDRRYTLAELAAQLPPENDDQVVAWLERQGMVHRHRSDSGLDITCPWAAEHTRGTDGDTSTTYWSASGGRVPGFRCLHGHCEGRDVKTLFEWIKGVDPRFKFPRPGYSPTAESVGYDDFYAHMVEAKFIYAPTAELWPAVSVNKRLPWKRTVVGKETIKIPPASWLARHRPVEQWTWAPGLPRIINNRLAREGGWIQTPGVRVFNRYTPPTLQHGDPDTAGPWAELVKRLWPDDAGHIFNYLAHRVQHPHEKINHALVLVGAPGIGKDTVLQPVIEAVGPWNVHDITPSMFLGRFNGFNKAVVLRISEARDANYDRYQFYEHMKIYAAAPPDVLRTDEKNRHEYYVANVLAPVITTNHKTTGLYLPADDRRHFVAASQLVKEDFEPEYWTALWAWYRNGGFGHVAAWLAQCDLATFDPKAPPKTTEAFWAIVDANRAGEDAEMADALDELGRPVVTTLDQVARHTTDNDFSDWLRERKNRRQIPHRFDQCGYSPVRNDAATDGQWKIGSRRHTVYGRRDIDRRTLIEHARLLAANG